MVEVYTANDLDFAIPGSGGSTLLALAGEQDTLNPLAKILGITPGQLNSDHFIEV